MIYRGKIWIDLSAMGGECIPCECELMDRELGSVEEFRAATPRLSDEQFERLINESHLLENSLTKGELHDGRQFECRIDSINSFAPLDLNSTFIQGHISHFKTTTTPATEVKPPCEWVFQLSNVKLRRGDVFSDYHCPGERRRNWDSIEFIFDGRTWRLTDTWIPKWKDTATSQLMKPVISGRLRTDFREGDFDSNLTDIVENVCHVLAIAMSRSVNWVSYSLNTADGTGIRGYSRATWVTGFNKHGFEPVANHEPHSLKTLLEISLPVIANDRDWYTNTLAMLTQAQTADMLEVRCSILYTLTDRISSRLVERTGRAEIDPGLKPRAKNPEFVEELHRTLKKLSPENWTEEHTASVLSEIKRWNKLPSFVEKIQRACNQVRLPMPDSTLLRARNELLHDGEMAPKDDSVVCHYFELDWLVLVMTLRLLGYEGAYYHPRNGSAPVLLKDQMIDNPVSVDQICES